MSCIDIGLVVAALSHMMPFISYFILIVKVELDKFYGITFVEELSISF